MNRDLDVYSYHPRHGALWVPIVIIAAMGVLGFVRGLMGSADLSLEPGFANRGPVAAIGKDPRPVVLETIPTLTPRLIGSAPPAPKAPVAVATAAATNAPATNAAVNAPVIAPIPVAKVEAPPVEAAPTAPAVTAPPPPPPPLQGLY